MRWKLVCGAHNIGYTAYFVAKPHLPLESEAEIEQEYKALQPMMEACTADGQAKPPPVGSIGERRHFR